MHDSIKTSTAINENEQIIIKIVQNKTQKIKTSKNTVQIQNARLKDDFI